MPFYSYVASSPVRFTDPLGLREFDNWPDFPLDHRDYFNWWSDYLVVGFEDEFLEQLTQGCIGVVCTFLGYHDKGNVEFQKSLSQCYRRPEKAREEAKKKKCCEKGKGKNAYGGSPSAHVVAVQFSSSFRLKLLPGETFEEFKDRIGPYNPREPPTIDFGRMKEPIDLSTDENWNAVITAPGTPLNFEFAIWVDPPGRWLGADNGVGAMGRPMTVCFSTQGQFERILGRKRPDLDVTLYCVSCEKDYNPKEGKK